MPVFHYTIHAYRSWNTDHPSGWVERNEPGIRVPNKGIAYRRDRIARFPPVVFTHEQQLRLMDSAQDICTRRNWRCHGAATDNSHTHLIVSWADGTDLFAARRTFKRLLGLTLARAAGTRGIPYLSAGAGIIQVKTLHHLNHLLYVYLPTHPLWWREPRTQDPT